MTNSKVFHILNGDCLAATLDKVVDKSQMIIWRECLIEGPVKEENFWINRQYFIAQTYAESEIGYQEKVLSEFQKFENIEEGSAIYFWFEDDVFCQLNFWFLLSEVKKDLKLFRVFPKEESWDGFANLEATDFENQIKTAIEISERDIALAKKLWKAFSDNDLEELKSLSSENSKVFRKLHLIVDSIIDLKSSETKSELKYLSENYKNFEDLCKEVKLKYGVFGFGDLQVKNLIK
ncbi:DUF1835 domain-containing protein [Soonwooa sp.]|uniref:DUF1835 domain-containing protein n=1 Tax=Soonwooa sp. TaxID=1938592 RepID=UPI00289D9BB1|nr:DUF1835 domain-containing protein [Soonwooa sp.]